MDVNLEKVFDELKNNRHNIDELIKQKNYFKQQEYEEVKAEANRIRQKYLLLQEETKQDIIILGRKNVEYSNLLYAGGFIDIEKFARDVTDLLCNNTHQSWEVIALAFNYKKRMKQSSGLVLVPTDANIIAVAKKGAISEELTNFIAKDKDWLNNSNALMAFWEIVNKGDIVLLHIVEQENKTERILNLFESGFNSDFDKYLLRFELEFNEKNPIHKYSFLFEYLDDYVYKQLKSKK